MNNVVFVPPASNAKLQITKPKNEIVSEGKHDKGKSILGAPPKIVKNETKQNNHHSSNKKSQLKKPHFCHDCGASRHTHPNCHKWLATQQSNSVSSFGGQNQFQNSLASLGTSSSYSVFNKFQWVYPSSYSPKQRSQKKKASSPSESLIWKEKDSFK